MKARERGTLVLVMAAVLTPACTAMYITAALCAVYNTRQCQ